jgi:hydrogenase/urease accessory protein HupE
MRLKTPGFRGAQPLCGILLLVLLMWGCAAQAHPLPLSYVDLRLERNGLEASVEAPAVDVAHELPRLSVTALLTPDTLQAHQQEIAALLTSHLTLSAAGKTLSASVEGIEPIPDQKDVRLRLRYVWSEPPTSLHIQCRLFPYDPAHRTYLDVYEGQALRREMIFDSQAVQQDYVAGCRQSIGAVIRQFLAEGVNHIFTGPDHILFIIGLLLLGGTLKQLLKIVTAFTVAHSVTLCLATLNILNPPARIIEPTIALSIVFVGVHSMVMRKRHPGERALPDTRLLFAFGFGFIHGFGFANALRELELPRQALVAALASFNLGVECGQACIVLTVAPLLALLHRKNARMAQRFVTSGSLAVIGAGAFWFVQRVLAG